MKEEILMNENKYIFDTHIFDSIIAGDLSIDLLEKVKLNGAKFYITHIQVDEINRIPIADKKEKLKQLMLEISSEVVPTETAVWGVSVWDQAKWETAGLYEHLQQGNLKHTEDALIGETAIVNKLILIINDKRFASRVKNLGGEVMTVEEFGRNLS